MGETSIEWTATIDPDGTVRKGYTFNAWTGCQKVSPGCDNCYAEGWSKRSGLVEWGPHAARRRTSPENWAKPLKWNRKAEAEGRRYKVFCASLADVFDNHASIKESWRSDLWEMIAATPHLDWLLLTKRPQNIRRYLPDQMETGLAPQQWGDGWPNVWLGTTVENQAEADRRIPVLLSIPAKVRFLSCEPMLGRIRLSGVSADGKHSWNWLTGENGTMYPDGPDFDQGPKLHWVICGGKSGPGARPMHPDWARSLRDQCVAAGVPFFMKQWGEWLPMGQSGFTAWSAATGVRGNRRDAGTSHSIGFASFNDGKGGRETHRIGPVKTLHNVLTVGRASGHTCAAIGKKRAGRLLDGRTWDEVPA